MAKSKNKKDQKKRAQARTQHIKAQKEKQKKEFMKMIEEAQKEAVNQQEEKNVVGAEELGDIGDDLALDL